jgi:hypothetical protein
MNWVMGGKLSNWRRQRCILFWRCWMKNWLTNSFALLAGFLIVCAPLLAHHGSSVTYNMKKAITLKGTVTEFVYTNPHCQLYFDVKDDAGNTIRWGGETMAPPSRGQGRLVEVHTEARRCDRD